MNFLILTIISRKRIRNKESFLIFKITNRNNKKMMIFWILTIRIKIIKVKKTNLQIFKQIRINKSKKMTLVIFNLNRTNKKAKKTSFLISIKILKQIILHNLLIINRDFLINSRNNQFNNNR